MLGRWTGPVPEQRCWLRWPGCPHDRHTRFSRPCTNVPRAWSKEDEVGCQWLKLPHEKSGGRMGRGSPMGSRDCYPASMRGPRVVAGVSGLMPTY